MNKTIAFTRLDIITIKPYLTLKNFLIFTFLCVFFGGFSGGITGMAFFMGYSLLYSSYPFASSEISDLEMLYSTLSIRRKDVVSGRYIFALIVDLVSGISSFILTVIVKFIFDGKFDITELAINLLALFFAFSIIQAFQFPIYFKMGYSKAKAMVYLPFIIIPLTILLAEKLLNLDIEGSIITLSNSFLSNPILIYGILFLIWILIISISYYFSNKFYSERDF